MGRVAMRSDGVRRYENPDDGDEPVPTRREAAEVAGICERAYRVGRRAWAAYIWDFITPLANRQMRGQFMLHELFHRIQPELGLMTHVGQNQHLDTVDGRF